MVKDGYQGRKSLSLRLLISGGKEERRRKIFGGEKWRVEKNRKGKYHGQGKLDEGTDGTMVIKALQEVLTDKKVWISGRSESI